MNLTFKYDTPLDDDYIIPAGTVVRRWGNWSEYEGFTAVIYKKRIYYFSDQNFVELCVKNKLLV